MLILEVSRGPQQTIHKSFGIKFGCIMNSITDGCLNIINKPYVFVAVIEGKLSIYLAQLFSGYSCQQMDDVQNMK